MPLSLADIRRTLEKEPYWIRPGTDKDPRNYHRPKTGGTHIKVWAVTLEQKPSSDTEEDAEFIFPPAEGLLAAIHTKEDEKG